MGRTPSEIVIRHRMNLFVLIKILLKYLSRIDPPLAARAQNVLKDCKKQSVLRQKEGKSALVVYGNLADVIERRMRLCVGDAHWQRAQDVCRKQNIIIGAKVEEQVREKKRKLMDESNQQLGRNNSLNQGPSKKPRETLDKYTFNLGSKDGFSSKSATSKVNKGVPAVKSTSSITPATKLPK